MKKIYRFIITITTAFMIFNLTSCTKKDKKKDKWELFWSDEFDGNELDTSKWSYQIGKSYNGWGNNELQYYRQENVEVKDGMLAITTNCDEAGNYYSGRIRTLTDAGEELFSLKYGKIVARISMPQVSGLWPAFWMMPVENKYGMWPMSGEIDIMEARGRIIDQINGTIHYGESIPNNKTMGTSFDFENGQTISDFHEYSIEWDTNSITWYVDGIQYYKTSNWYTKSDDGQVADYPAPFNERFYLILNMAAGGTYDEGIIPLPEQLPAQMLVDYVRVYRNADGYSKVNSEKKLEDMDTTAGDTIIPYTNMINDINFDTINIEPELKTPDYTIDKWYFVTKTYFTGKAHSQVVNENGNNLFMCSIDNPGDKRYSVQLQHKISLVKGYTYTLEFDARADNDRIISFQPIGKINGEEKSYADTIEVPITKDLSHYYYSFTMKEDTDLSAVAEFNFGLEMPTVYFGNVQIYCNDY